jgi:hypothetical protein
MASVLAVLVAMSAMVHGYREILLGNTPTGGMLLASVGAFTLIPNYLLTGIATIAVSVAAIVWAVRSIDRRNGPLVLLVLFILLFLVGGGVAQVVVFTLVWAISTRIGKPLTWWRRTLPERVRHRLAGLWAWLFAISLALFAIGIEIWLFGYVPGVTDAILKLHICWSFLVAGLAVLLVAVVAAFAHDIEGRAPSDGRAHDPEEACRTRAS